MTSVAPQVCCHGQKDKLVVSSAQPGINVKKELIEIADEIKLQAKAILEPRFREALKNKGILERPAVFESTPAMAALPLLAFSGYVENKILAAFLTAIASRAWLTGFSYDMSRRPGTQKYLSELSGRLEKLETSLNAEKDEKIIAQAVKIRELLNSLSNRTMIEYACDHLVWLTAGLSTAVAAGAAIWPATNVVPPEASNAVPATVTTAASTAPTTPVAITVSQYCPYILPAIFIATIAKETLYKTVIDHSFYNVARELKAAAVDLKTSCA